MNYLTLQQVSELISLPLKHLEQQYPNHIAHLLNSDEDVKSPKQMHPIFYGCLDWHSAVHGYWLLLSALEKYPDIKEKNNIENLFNKYFTTENIKQELNYFTEDNRSSYERPYGIAWLLALDSKLFNSKIKNAKQLWNNLQPLTTLLKQRLYSYFDNLTYPIRTGTHNNSAFALSLMFKSACDTEDQETQNFVIKVAERYFKNDTNYPFNYEPNGDDFLSAGLTEALLMSYCSNDFDNWLSNFIGSGSLPLDPAIITDPTDPKLSHLEGLNLSRSWCLIKIANKSSNSTLNKRLIELANKNLSSSLNNVVNSHYSGSHWLGTFAFLAISA